ncbi:D-glycerate dehydrogenase [Amylibacter sp. IMCC11727]|uniref:2-hydroxyacid dehydrogenase n=1 Tax=Amylibacter sp. IMCC11727 TaxID=3039851 RepID=UPI00244DE021|nr:D-glycerate dehydrogenase [Amylibacter sp. IMCC11727]WGI23025.1 D-glycerate dehydrogenase [Amylibacter sp. IMCC11727]
MSGLPTVYITRPLPDAVLEEARNHFDVTVRTQTLPMSDAETAAALAGYDAVLPTLGDPLSAGAFGGTIRAKMLGNFGVGYNHIDVAAAQKAGMVVSNTPGAVTDATADIAVLLMLMTARRASIGEAAVRDGTWEGWYPTQFLGLHVSGKTLGVIGMGRIGKAIAKRCHYGFGMDVVFYNRSRVADCGVPARQLDTIAEVMSAADVVSLSVPGGPANHHMIGAAELAAMRPHGVLVNTARGDVVDEAALIAALQSGAIGGAGLDVYENEPSVPEALRALQNVSLLPHLGTAALEVRVGMGLMAVENLRAFFAGEDVPNAVNP